MPAMHEIITHSSDVVEKFHEYIGIIRITDTNEVNHGRLILGNESMCTPCAQTLQHQSQLRGIHKIPSLTVHDRKDLFVCRAPI
jgi:hypothetical protein